MVPDSNIGNEVKRILETRGLPNGELTLTDGFANVVVLTPSHVVRLNSGRFPQAFLHEARVLSHLPGDIPHPVAVAHGHRDAGGEYLVLERLPGDNLQAIWSTMSPGDQQQIIFDLAEITQQLHALPKADWMRNAWMDDVLVAHPWQDAYHAPPWVSLDLIESAMTARPDLKEVLGETSQFIDQRLYAFGNEVTMFIHTDLHFRNVMVANGQITGLIDFEGSRLGPPDVELDMLLRTLVPAAPESTSQYGDAVWNFKETYPQLFEHPCLIARLEVYETLWHLVQLHHWKPGDRWTNDPAQPLNDVILGKFGVGIRHVLGHRVR